MTARGGPCLILPILKLAQCGRTIVGASLCLPHEGVQRRTGRGPNPLRVTVIPHRQRRCTERTSCTAAGTSRQVRTSGCGSNCPLRAGPPTARPPPRPMHKRATPGMAGDAPETCKTPGRTPPNTTPRGKHPRHPYRWHLVLAGQRPGKVPDKPLPAVIGRAP